MVGGVFRGFLRCFCGFLVPFFPSPFVCIFYAYGVVRVPPTALNRSEFPTMLKSIVFIWIIE